MLHSSADVCDLQLAPPDTSVKGQCLNTFAASLWASSLDGVSSFRLRARGLWHWQGPADDGYGIQGSILGCEMMID